MDTDRSIMVIDGLGSPRAARRSPRSPRKRVRRAAAILGGLAAFVGATLAAAPVAAQAALPFFPGEELTYRMRVGMLGTVGSGTMRVEGPVNLRGTPTLVLRSEMRSTVSLVKGFDRTSSWFDPLALRTLRFEKQERSPFGNLDEAVDVFGSERRWLSATGTGGRSTSDSPLDELSFIYFIRTLPLKTGSVYTFDRHFDTRRNPVTVKVLRREKITVGAGEFPAVLVEMRVRDPLRYRGEGVIKIHISDGECRLPLRIESAVPTMGTTVLTLESHTHPREHFHAHGE